MEVKDKMVKTIVVAYLAASFFFLRTHIVSGLLYPPHLALSSRLHSAASSTILYSREGEEVYKNPVAAILGNFLPPSNPSSSSSPSSGGIIDKIDFSSSKRRKKTSLPKLASELSIALREREWFVTGNVAPSFFSEDFCFSDPDVKVKGIEVYARGVNKLFDQKVTRGQIISCVAVEEENKIQVLWRLEGRVKIGNAGLPIKAFLVNTSLFVNAEGLINLQVDTFSIPGWDIFISSVLPWLKLPFLAPPAAPLA